MNGETQQSTADISTQHKIWKYLKNIAYTVFVVLTDSYGVLMTVFLVLRLFVDEFQWPIIGVFNSAFPMALLPVFIMLPGSLYIRRWRLASFTLPALLFFVFNYGVFFLPNSIDVADDAPTLTILSYNTKSAQNPADPIADVILAADADIVLLQEMSVPLAEYLAVELIEEYPYQALYGIPRNVMGQGVLSRYPITADELLKIVNRKGFLRVEIEIDGQAITIYNIHPHVPMYSSGFHGKGQKMAIDEIMVMVESEVNPVIIGGDMNMTDQFSAYRHITADLHDAYREVGWGLGFTFPNLSGTSFSIFPRILRLDYVFYDNTFQATEARVWSSSGGSDHRPLLVTLAIVSDE